jgi:hypothetical protein
MDNYFSLKKESRKEVHHEDIMNSTKKEGVLAYRLASPSKHSRREMSPQ